MNAFIALEEPTTKRRASAPARDYEPMDANTTAPQGAPALPPGLERVEGAAFQSLIKNDIPKLVPELGEIVRLAEREAQILQAAAQFTHIAARADYEQEAQALRADPTPGNMEKLKNIGSMADRLDNYARQHHALDQDAVRVRKEAAPLIRAASERIIARLIELARQAETEEAALLQKWKIPTAYAPRTRPHIIRPAQELARFCEDQDQGRFHATISSWLKRFI